jgi:hypothetical protein
MFAAAAERQADVARAACGIVIDERNPFVALEESQSRTEKFVPAENFSARQSQFFETRDGRRGGGGSVGAHVKASSQSGQRAFLKTFCIGAFPFAPAFGAAVGFYRGPKVDGLIVK